MWTLRASGQAWRPRLGRRRGSSAWIARYPRPDRAARRARGKSSVAALEPGTHHIRVALWQIAQTIEASGAIQMDLYIARRLRLFRLSE